MKRDFRIAKAMSNWKLKETVVSVDTVFQTISLMSEKNGIVNEKEMKTRLSANLVNGKPQPILIIWGPPYEGQGKNNISLVNQPESTMIQQIVASINKIKDTGLKIIPILIYADEYGNLNGISEKEVEIYANKIKSMLPCDFLFKRVTDLFRENSLVFSTLKKAVSDANLNPTYEEINSAVKIQKKLRSNKNNYTELAENYKRLRLIEGKLISGNFIFDKNIINNAIKLSTAPNKSKDDPYEPSLPRFYVKNLVKAAWNKPRNLIYG